MKRIVSLSFKRFNKVTSFQIRQVHLGTAYQLQSVLFFFQISFQVTCMIGSLFQNTVNVVNIKLPVINKENESVSEVTLDK